MKPTKMTSLLLSVVLSISMVMTPVGVVADDSVPSEEQTTEMTETTKETETTVTKKPSVEETEKSETEETKASEKPVDKETKTTESEVSESSGEKVTGPTEEKALESPKEETPEETKDKENEESKPNESETVEGRLPEQTTKVSPKSQSDSNPKTIHILDNVNNIYINIDIPDTNNYSWALNGNRGFIVRYINTGYHSPKEIMIGSAEDAEGYAEKYDMWKGMYDYAHDNPGAYDDSMYKKDFKDGVLIGNENTSTWFWISGNYHFVIAVNGSPAEVEKLLGYITVRSGDGIQDDNPLAVKGKTATVKYKKLRKKSQTLSVSKVLAFTRKGQGKLTYAKVSGNKKIKINKTTGKITVKKKLKKKTYKVKIKVKAAGNDQYKPSGWKTVTFKIKVK